MIETRKGGGFDLSCDTCGVSEEVDAANWNELMAHMTAEGWRKRPQKGPGREGVWLHFCPGCVADGLHHEGVKT